MNKKKILAGVLSAVITVGAISGIVIGVKASSRSTVMVIQASELNYGGYWGSSSQMQGMISSDVSQDVYLTCLLYTSCACGRQAAGRAGDSRLQQGRVKEQKRLTVKAPGGGHLSGTRLSVPADTYA